MFHGGLVQVARRMVVTIELRHAMQNNNKLIVIKARC
jgi:hypothetical protein